MTNLSDLFPAGAGKQVSFVADGAISAAGEPVILNVAGTVTPVGESTLATAIPLGIVTTFITGEVFGPLDADFDRAGTAGRGVVVYIDADNSDYPTAVVFDVTSAGVLSSQTAVVINSAGGTYLEPPKIAFDYNTAGSAVITYPVSSGTQLHVVNATLSGTTLTMNANTGLGTYTAAYSSGSMRRIQFEPSTAGKFCVGVNFGTNLEYIVGTISGTSAPSMGTPVSIGGQYWYNTVNWNPNVTDQMVAVYRNGSNYGAVKIATVTGTSISWGVESTFSSRATNYINFDWDALTAGSFAISYHSSGGYTLAGGLSGTTWTFGADNTSISDVAAEQVIRFNPSTANQLVNSWANEVSSYDPTLNVGTVAANAITWGSNNALTGLGGKAGAGEVGVIAFVGSAMPGVFAQLNVPEPSDDLKGQGCRAEAASTNLTATNFTGISDAAISDTASGNITVKGGIAVNGLTSLTPGTDYYAQGDGTISTSSSGDAVKLGRALSATSIDLEYQS